MDQKKIDVKARIYAEIVSVPYRSGASVIYHVETIPMQCLIAGNPRIKGCSLESVADFSDFLEADVLSKEYLGKDGLTYIVIGLTNDSIPGDIKLHQGNNCRALNSSELEGMSDMVKASLR